MKFIRHALIGIAVYEAVKYLWNNRTPNFASEAEGLNSNTSPYIKIRKEETDIIKGASQDHLQQLSQPHAPLSQNADDPLETGSNPNAALTGQKADPNQDDPWKNSLADDELRAPDS